MDQHCFIRKIYYRHILYVKPIYVLNSNARVISMAMACNPIPSPLSPGSRHVTMSTFVDVFNLYICESTCLFGRSTPLCEKFCSCNNSSCSYKEAMLGDVQHNKTDLMPNSDICVRQASRPISSQLCLVITDKGFLTTVFRQWPLFHVTKATP